MTPAPLPTEEIARLFEKPRFGRYQPDGSFQQVPWNIVDTTDCEDCQWLGGDHDAKVVRAAFALLAEIEAGRAGAERVREAYRLLGNRAADLCIENGQLRNEIIALRQAAQPALAVTYPADFKWCQPDKRGQRRLMVTFEDPDQGIATFETEAEARSYFAQADIGWNCTLWAAMPIQPEAAQPAGRVDLTASASYGGPDHRSGRYWISLDFPTWAAWRAARVTLGLGATPPASGAADDGEIGR